MELRTIESADIAGKRVLMRVDFNVPEQEGVLGDDLRIKAVVPTIELIKKKGAAHITLLTHWGRPEGKVVEALRTAPLFKRLTELTDTANIEMLENVRFDPREESNDEAYAKELAAHGDIFVNDAFAVCHRAAASVVGITKFLPSYAGLLVEREVQNLSQALMPPPNAVAIIGGAKFETKAPLLTKLVALYSKVLVGGAIANDLVSSRGTKVSSSVTVTASVPAELKENTNLLSPTDLVFKTPAGENKNKTLAEIAPEDIGFDIGNETMHEWAEILKQTPFILWNGPVGWYEGGYGAGTDALAEALTSSSAQAVVGGGNTVEALSKFTFDPSRVFVSTGGGAMLEFIAQGTLPGLEPLRIS